MVGDCCGVGVVKILEYKERDGMLEITTDFALMPVFVYPSDRFKNFPALEREMEKKMIAVTMRTQRADSRLQGLIAGLDARVVRDGRD